MRATSTWLGERIRPVRWGQLRVVSIFERFVYATPWLRLVVLVYLFALIKSGVWYFPSVGAYSSIANDPLFLEPVEYRLSYQVHNWLSAFLAWIAGATSDLGFTLLHFGFSLAFYTTAVLTFRARLTDAQARAALVLFMALPMSFTSHFWIGIDGLTLWLIALTFALLRYLAVVFVLAILLGLQHFEQGIFAASAALWTAYIARRLGYQQTMQIGTIWVMLAGVVVGKAMLSGLIWVQDVEVYQDRAGWLWVKLRMLLWDFFRGLPAILWSTLGVAWIFALFSLDRGRAALAPLIGLALLVPVLAITADQTRVFAIVSAPLLFNAWLLNPGALAAVSRPLVAGIFLAWLVVPIGWVASGEPKWSVLAYPFGALVQSTFGVELIEPSISYWPFR